MPRENRGESLKLPFHYSCMRAIDLLYPGATRWENE